MHLLKAGGMVGGYNPERLSPLLERHGEARLCAAIDAAAADAWYRRQRDRLRPEVVFGPTQLPILLRKAKAKAAKRPAIPAAIEAWAKQRPAAGATCPGGTCAWCNESQVYHWDGSDWQPDPAHQPCREAAQRRVAP